MTTIAPGGRIQLALRVNDLDAAVEFYSRLFAAEPSKQRPGYANFALEAPPLKLVLIEGEGGGSIDHLGVEVADTAEVGAAADRLQAAGLAAFGEEDVSCCYAKQDKVWVRGPDGEPWEVYTVLGDADRMASDTPERAAATISSDAEACCAPECCP
jgi:catechol 2,3-dioxygenase-like lactoylglutathione lyase family enzyme